MTFRFLALVTLLLPAAAPCWGATQLVLWTFGPDGAYTTSATSGVASGSAVLTLADGDLDANGKNGVDYTDSQSTLHPGGQAGAWNDVKVTGPDAEALIEFSTLGYKDLGVRFDYRSEGPTSFDLAYSFDGVSFNEMLDNEEINVNWASGNFETFSADLSSVWALNNVGTLYFRLDDLEEGDGNDRFAFDNLEFTATPIPEPSTTLLLLATLGLGSRRRRSTVAGSDALESVAE